MALHPAFPTSPYAVLEPDQRWFPAAEELRTAYEKLLPPLVAKIRIEVKAWRDSGYAGASPTSRALLNWWFDTDYLQEQADGTHSPFRYYFAQREAVETVIWLHDVRRARDKFDLLRFDASGAVSSGMFLTNNHRVFLSDVPEPSLDDEDLRNYFLAPFGPKPSGKTTDSKTDLGELVREIDELAVFNDEAHHIHAPRMAWFKSIQDIHLRMLQKDRRLALQVDVTATPRHDNGAIFVQTVADYPLVEAIHQNVVKQPVLPDAASRSRLHDVRPFRTEWREHLTPRKSLFNRIVDLPQKMKRLAQWCADASAASQAAGGPAYRFVYVDQVGFEKHPPQDFAGLATSFREYQNAP